MNEQELDVLARMSLLMGGLNVLTPQSVKDLKIAELSWGEGMEDKYTDIKIALSDCSQEGVEALLKRAILDYAKPMVMHEIQDWVKKLILDSATYLYDHKEERATPEQAREDFINWITKTNPDVKEHL